MKTKKEKILAALAAGQDAATVAKKFGVSKSYVYVTRWKANKKKPAKKKAAVEKAYDELSKKYTDGLAKSMKNTTDLFTLEKVKKALDPNSPLNWKWVDLSAEAEIPQTDKKPTKLLVQPDHLEKAINVLKTQYIDPVNSPPHYTAGGIETIDFIEAKDFNYRLGNVIKYVSRAGKKVDGDPITDLEKAKWYLDREIDTRKGA
jgi:hypothetical protein